MTLEDESDINSVVQDVPLSSDSRPVFTPPISPEPLQVILTDEERHSFTLHESALEYILLRPEVRNLPVAVISVAGAFRKGKSFLLNFFLRYLRHKVNFLYSICYIQHFLTDVF